VFQSMSISSVFDVISPASSVSSEFCGAMLVPELFSKLDVTARELTERSGSLLNRLVRICVMLIAPLMRTLS